MAIKYTNFMNHGLESLVVCPNSYVHNYSELGVNMLHLFPVTKINVKNDSVSSLSHLGIPS